MSATRDPEICIYCQTRKANSREHVFSKCFFGKPLPRMMTLPACMECNSGRGDGGPHDLCLDEEYLRTILATEYRAMNHPTAKRLIENQISKSFSRNPKLLYRVLDGSFELDAERRALVVDSARANRVIRKMVRGVFFEYNNRILPLNSPIEVQRVLSDTAFAKLNEAFETRMPFATQWWNIGDEKAICYRGGMNSRESNESVWLIVFYGSVSFVAYTSEPPSDAK